MTKPNSPDRQTGHATGPGPAEPVSSSVQAGDSIDVAGFTMAGVLGRGGMGVVLLMTDDRLNRQVAVKTALDDSKIPGFLGEAQIMAQLEHPSIVPAYDIGLTADGKPLYTMPRIEGTTLHDTLSALRKQDPEALVTWSLPRLIGIFQRVVAAVGYAHSRGVVHRDLKPSNIMLGEFGRVYLLDWGLSLLLDTHPDAPPQEPVGLTGTPGYMSPEQVAEEPIDQRADIYTLGVILYELLTWQRPFRGDPIQVLSDQLRQPPPEMLEPHPDRSIPRRLRETCLKALAKSPDDRHQTADELHDELQEWVELDAEAAHRQRQARGRVRTAEERIAALAALESELHALEAEVVALQKQFEPWQPLTVKQPLLTAEDRQGELRHRRNELRAAILLDLSVAIQLDAANDQARRLIADTAWQHAQAAEATGDRNNEQYFRALVGAYHDGRFTRELAGDGSLTLQTDPPGAEVSLHRLVERDLILRPHQGRLLGRTPLRVDDVAMGSYLAVLKKPGFRDVSYPLLMTRNAALEFTVLLLSDLDIGPDMVYVPAGPFRKGAAAGSSSKLGELVLDGFLIGARHVTFAEFLEFLNAVADEHGPQAALHHAPRSATGQGQIVIRRPGDDLALNDQEVDGLSWQPDWPALGITGSAAEAYCEWRSRRDGRSYRLPTEQEYEKAARGVDGRTFPWGDRFDPSLCNIGTSRAGGPSPVPVGSTPGDVSIYGVCDTAGNAISYTTAVEDDSAAQGLVVYKGNAWPIRSWQLSRCAFRAPYAPGQPNAGTGFRLACGLHTASS